MFSSGGSSTPRKTPARNWVFLGIVVLINLMLVSFLLSPSSPASKDYSAFQTDVSAGNVTTIVNSDSTLTVTLKNGDNYTTVSDTPQDGEWATIEGWLKASNVDPKTWPTYNNKPPADTGWILTLVTFLLPMLFLGFIIYYFMRSAQGVNNAALGFGKSRAKMFLQGGKTSVTFADVAGVDEAKAELQEVVEFLKYPEKFSSLGARIPRGVLVVGPPGSGKTLIAKAVANEAGVPFFSISGSEFVEMFVGVGASVTGDTPIMVRSSAGLELLPIAEFVDRHYQAGKSGRVVTVNGIETLGYAPPSGQSHEGLLADGGTCAWVGVRAVLRHPVSEIYEIAYAGGTLRATGDHSVFVRAAGGLAVSPTRFLRPGDRLVLARTVETCALGSPEELMSLVTQAQKLSVSAAWEKILGATDGSLALRPTSDPVVLSVNKLPYNGYVYDLVGCDNEAFFGGQAPVLLHNSRVRDLFDQAKRNAPCLTGDALITLSDGSRIPIEEMYERQMVGAKVVSMTPRMTLQPATVQAITRRAAPDLYEIATNLGVVKATGNHLFPVMREGRVNWELAETLHKGDYVAAPRIIRTENRELPIWDLLPDQTSVHSDKGRPWKLGLIRANTQKLNAAKRLSIGRGGFGSTRVGHFPQVIPWSFAYLSGLLASDGHFLLRREHAVFTNTEPVLNKLFADILEDLFGYRPNSRLNKKNFDLLLPQDKGLVTLKDCYNTLLNNKLITILFKRFEAGLLSAPRPLIAAWLRGVFDGDGSVRTTAGNEQIVISSYNPADNDLIRAALLRLGIPTSRRSDHENHFDGNIVIGGRDHQQIFINEVGSAHPAKIVKLALLADRLKRTTSSRLDGIPVGNLLRETRLSLGMGQRSFAMGHQVSSYERNLHSASRASLMARVQEMDNWRTDRDLESSPTLEELRSLASGDIMWAQVQQIQRLNPVDYVYDLVLDEYHNFIANELVVHNCVVFVDEIDAVGRQRGTGLGGSHDEREQTLNQILVEMDGFDSGTSVIVIAATNRPDVLDPALLRPGRFDRQVILDRPDLRGRFAILQIHLKGKPIAKTVNVESLARQTPGFSGADLANLTNEAAILAARRNKKAIEMTDFSEAIERVSVGPQRASRIISDAEKRIIAIHEGGHAVVQRILPKCDPVHKVTIISRGMALGYTSALPTEDRYLQSKSEFEDKIAGLLAGHAAERLMFGDTTTGASNDIEKATALARKMVTEWGMSEKLGPLVFGRKDEAVFLGRELGEQRNYSDEIAYLIDEEVSALIKGGYARATQVLEENKMRLMRLADKLIAEETVEGAEFEALFADLPPKEPIHAMNPAVLSPDAEITDGGATPVA